MNPEEKAGGRPFNPQLALPFLEFMFEANILDLNFEGVPFTWCNNRFRNQGEALVGQRLDRAICNTKWRTLFPKAKTINLPFSESDHGPIVVLLDPNCRSGPKLHFQSMWATCLSYILSIPLGEPNPEVRHPSGCARSLKMSRKVCRFGTRPLLGISKPKDPNSR